MMVLEKINIILHLVLCRKSLVKGKPDFGWKDCM